MEKYVSQTQTVKVNWLRNDFSRIPFWLYHDKDVYQLEQDRIFKGAAWSYVGLEAELPNPGDFRTTYVGETSVILQRTQEGSIHAMVNRCAHRGAKVRREIRGNASEHICIYHRWCYSDTGELTGVPFLRGIKGQGGMGKDFKTQDHGLQQLRVAVHAGVIFVTFSTKTEPLEDYLGPVFTSHLSRIFNRPVRVLGYQRQRIAGNWKLYLENQRDTYHGSLLHEFQSTFGTSRATQSGGVTMDSSQRHNLTYARAGTDNDEEFKTLYKENKVHESKLSLEDPSMIRNIREFDDGISLAICGLFPNSTIHQIGNSLATRQLRTFGPDEFELYWTLFGYEDDSDEMTEHRLSQANMVGPAGLISMEDGEAIEITHRATKTESHWACSVVEMGGAGPIVNLEHRVNDIAVRGFWSGYAKMMDFAPMEL